MLSCKNAEYTRHAQIRSKNPTLISPNLCISFGYFSRLVFSKSINSSTIASGYAIRSVVKCSELIKS